MVNESNFIVRVSGRKENSYYVDYAGAYKVADISKAISVDAPTVKQKYVENGASYDESMDVYYFPSIEGAKKAIEELLKGKRADRRGRMIFLTEKEIEYIRKALINENSNTIHVSNKVKDAIFEKLNR